MTTLDPDTTEEGEEPLLVFDTFRTGDHTLSHALASEQRRVYSDGLVAAGLHADGF